MPGNRPAGSKSLIATGRPKAYIGLFKKPSRMITSSAPTTVSSNQAVTRLKAGQQELVSCLHQMDAAAWIKLNAGLLDEYFQTCFTASTAGPRLDILQNPYALLALGGYGRAEQCLHSDVDLLILFKGKVPPEAESLVQEIIYPLWDLGMEVGHATRSIKETIRLARKDFEVLTSLLDARFVCGMSPLYHELMEQLRRRLINTKPRLITDWLVKVNAKRHDRFGDSSYLLEPNLKEGQGGLRDYHTILWIGRVKVGARSLRDLEYNGLLSHAEYRLLASALEFIWCVRNNLHQLTGRKCDQLHLEYQSQITELMGFTGGDGHLPVEQLLGELHRHMEHLKQCHRNFISEIETGHRRRRKKRGPVATGVPDLLVERGVIKFRCPEAIVRRPLLLMEIFFESALHRTPLGVEAQRLVREFGDLVETRLRSDRQAAVLFEHLLIRPADALPALNQMLVTGFLQRYIPYWHGVVNRVQFDHYHLYPVARHLLLTVRRLKEIGLGRRPDGDPLSRQVYKEIKAKRPLFWAALLHDIGKAVPAKGHAERGARLARQILEEKVVEAEVIDMVAFLVRHHLLLMKTATRRDISEEETVVACARKIGSADRLKMLYLLSVADAMATGPKAWNQWTASLMRDLFLRVRKVLGKRELFSDRTENAIAEKKTKVIDIYRQAGELEAAKDVVPALSRRYLIHCSAAEIQKHIELYRQLEGRRFVWRIDDSDLAGDSRVVTICAQDRPGLLSKIAGVFTLNNVNILHVRIFTWHNKVALDIFEVTAPPDRLFESQRWETIAAQLEDALAGRMNLPAKLARCRYPSGRPRTAGEHRPQKVVIDNTSSSFFTIVEVTAWDYPGLLFNITNALYECGLDIWVAKIATRIDQVVDVFYVRSIEGEKADQPGQEETIRKAVTAILQ